MSIDFQIRCPHSRQDAAAKGRKPEAGPIQIEVIFKVAVFQQQGCTCLGKRQGQLTCDAGTPQRDNLDTPWLWRLDTQQEGRNHFRADYAFITPPVAVRRIVSTGVTIPKIHPGATRESSPKGLLSRTAMGTSLRTHGGPPVEKSAREPTVPKHHGRPIMSLV